MSSQGSFPNGAVKGVLRSPNSGLWQHVNCLLGSSLESQGPEFVPSADHLGTPARYSKIPKFQKESSCLALTIYIFVQTG